MKEKQKKLNKELCIYKDKLYIKIAYKLFIQLCT